MNANLEIECSTCGRPVQLPPAASTIDAEARATLANTLVCTECLEAQAAQARRARAWPPPPDPAAQARPRYPDD